MATVPFMGVWPALVTDEGKEMDRPCQRSLVIKKPWPGLMRGVYGDPKRFQETYFEQFPGYYTAGDGARRDKDGYYQITGRIDDVINVSVTEWAPRKWKAPSLHIPRSPKPPWSLSHDIKGSRFMPM